MSFKLLAIRPLKGCDENLINNLHEDEFYFFNDAYEAHNKLEFIKKKKDYIPLDENFFYTNKNSSHTSLTEINIQAIVGKNGSGKSTIIEFLLRMLNNFFKNINKKNEATKKLIYVKGLFGELYFQKENFIYKLLLDFRIIDKTSKINTVSKIIKFHVDDLDNLNKSVNNLNLLNSEETDDKYILEVSEYFFTMYVNYSLYGLDEEDFTKEGYTVEVTKDDYGNKVKKKISWLNKIFHKNDGYQTPVVIHPYRERAMIDVRREKDLMKQRLSALIFTNKEYRKIIPNYQFDKIRLIKKDNFSLNSFLIEIIKNPTSDIKPTDIFGENINVSNIEEKVLYLKNWIGENSDLLNHYNEIKKKYDQNNLEPSKIFNIKFKTDLHTTLFFSYAYLNNHELRKDEDINKESYFSIKYNELDKNKINFVYKKFEIEYNNIIRDTSYLSFSSLITLIQLTKSYDYFIEFFNYSKQDFNFIINDNNNIKNNLFWYSVIKSLKILKYNTLPELNNAFLTQNLLKHPNNKIDLFFLKYFEDLVYGNKSHVTEKLRRTLLLINLINNPINLELKSSPKKENFNSTQLINFYNKIKENNEEENSISELSELIIKTKDIFDSHYKTNVELTDLLPPPIFNYDFYSNDLLDQSKKIPLSKISSGQFQKIGLLSSIVYHLKNLDSITLKDHFYDYKNILIILDEIELYFHPEQQKTFINDLIGLLKANSFKKIENLNIFFITHSPFILSDIPSQNVLKLEDGKMKRTDDKNSFGANIHDLLADEFFLANGFMGEFALKKINECIILLNWKTLYKDWCEIIDSIRNKKLETLKKRDIKDLFLQKTIKINNSILNINELNIIWQSKIELENNVILKDIENIDVYIDSLKNQIFNTINIIGESLIKVELLEMFRNAFTEKEELQKLLKERELLDKRIAKLEMK